MYGPYGLRPVHERDRDCGFRPPEIIRLQGWEDTLGERLNMTDIRVIDTQALDRLKEWGGDKLAGQMVRLFLKNSGVRMEQIRTGVREEDHDEAERGSHSLKSSAANVGAEAVRQLATQIETAALEQDYDRLRRTLPEIEAAYGAAIAELETIERDMPHES